LAQSQRQRQPGKPAAPNDNASLCRHEQSLTQLGKDDLLP
jgi:hypothetical protein